MRLLRLLAAGKSLIGIKEESGRYRLSSGNALPKFAAAAHPFRATVRPSAGAVQESLLDGQAALAPEPQPPAVEDKEPESKPAKPGGIQVPVCLADKRAEAGRFKRMVACLWPDRGVQGRGARRAVQGELQLDQIKVVRNDLTDTDLEVVHRRPGKAPDKVSTGALETGPVKAGKVAPATQNRSDIKAV